MVDVGGGTGRVSSHFSGLTANVLVCDINRSMLKQARRKKALLPLQADAEDVEIQKRLRPMGRFVKIRQPVRTSARRFLSHGIIRQQVLNIGLVFLYHTGVSPSRLKRFYG